MNILFYSVVGKYYNTILTTIARCKEIILRSMHKTFLMNNFRVIIV